MQQIFGNDGKLHRGFVFIAYTKSSKIRHFAPAVVNVGFKVKGVTNQFLTDAFFIMFSVSKKYLHITNAYKYAVETGFENDGPEDVGKNER